MSIEHLSEKTQRTLKNIRNLPICIDTETEDIVGLYINERKDIHKNKQLKEFTRRWNTIWKIPWSKNWQMSEHDRLIVAGRYDAKKVFRCIGKNMIEKDGCKHVLRNNYCVGVNILVPQLLIEIIRIRHFFAVPDWVILLQLTRALHDDIRDVDPDDFFRYIRRSPITEH